MIDKLPHTMPRPVIYGAMVLGLLAALSFRVLTIVEVFNPALVRPIWYFGVLGYILFFAYRYFITEKRKRVITANRLLEKLKAEGELNRDDRLLLDYVLSSVVKSKEHVNYIFIVVISIIVVVIDLWLTVF
ncbi:hypothetical protein [Desulfurivibrio alkaliphilus]|uniref:Uncharacterized protein n=1 Tax=Desulfurivibrio alkaliphilus (strain DSM 19089 / UNIQEM U267 / AHT2) TaxID=589865 RepID=D6Z1F4_DESAT|nr:hypothetical protein [Desulfurivibrio alkaliphilus]ADH85409.1 conserved hypothetical protein [Desulfurivibrio alkaliphilus AHT 2]